MAIHPFIIERPDGIYLSLKVQPRSSVNELCGVHGPEFKLKISAPPVDSAANEAVLKFLAEKLQIPRRAVELVRGATSRHKQVRVTGLSRNDILRGLGLPEES